MGAMVVYDSKWGNTELVAKAIAEGLGGDARALRVGEGTEGAGQAGLLVLGSPVIGGRPTKAMKDFIATLLGQAAPRCAVATFDTRMPTEAARKFGFAATRMAEQLGEAGHRLVGEPLGFVVTGQKGPLADGEVERALEWGRDLASRI